MREPFHGFSLVVAVGFRPRTPPPPEPAHGTAFRGGTCAFGPFLIPPFDQLGFGYLGFCFWSFLIPPFDLSVSAPNTTLNAAIWPLVEGFGIKCSPRRMD